MTKEGPKVNRTHPLLAQQESPVKWSATNDLSEPWSRTKSTTRPSPRD